MIHLAICGRKVTLAGKLGYRVEEAESYEACLM
jgi:hypothetical protein